MVLLSGDSELEDCREMLPTEPEAPAQLRPSRTGLMALVTVPLVLLVGFVGALAWPKRGAASSLGATVTVLTDVAAEDAKHSQSPAQAQSDLQGFINKGLLSLRKQCIPQCPAVIERRRARRLGVSAEEAALAAYLGQSMQKEDTGAKKKEVPLPWEEEQRKHRSPKEEAKQLTQFLADDQESEQLKAAEKAQEKCEMDCEDEGFLAEKHWRACKADCLVKHPIPGKKVAGKRPLVVCMDECPTRGELWHLRFDSCEQRCKSKTVKDEALYRKQMILEGYPEEMLQVNTNETKVNVVAKVTKRITIKARPEGEPIAKVFALYEELWKRSLKTVLPADLGNFYVTLRRYPGAISTEIAEEGRRLQIINEPLAFITDPGDDIEAVAEISEAPADIIDKLVDPALPPKVDSVFDDLIKTTEFSFMDGAANLLPCDVSETTSVSVDGPYVSMGWNTVCRASEADNSVDNVGKASVYYGKTLRDCSQECEKLGPQRCYGFEYRASRLRCEIWKDPICHSEPLSLLDASVADFRCFKRCK